MDWGAVAVVISALIAASGGLLAARTKTTNDRDHAVVRSTLSEVHSKIGHLEGWAEAHDSRHDTLDLALFGRILDRTDATDDPHPDPGHATQSREAG